VATCAAGAVTGSILLVLDRDDGDQSLADQATTTGAPLEPRSSDGPSTSTTTAENTTTATTTGTKTGTTGGTTGERAVAPAGFDLTAARVTAADGTVCELCLWLADSVELRNRGLMGVTDLGPADGMAFVYPEPHTTRFWMKDTLLPLSIVFYGSNGEFLDSFDMEPCVARNSEDCARYPTATDFVIAVETHQGGLPGIGMLAGSTLELFDLACRQGTPDSG